MNRRILALAAGILAVATLARSAYLLRPGLWADEFFSLALATGHSLEHPAASAGSERGDYVAAKGPRSAGELAALLEMPAPPATLPEITRAVLRSDTSPPLYLWLLSFWFRGFGTSDLALRSFTLLGFVLAAPFVFLLGRRIAGPAAGLAALVVFAASPLGLYYSVEGRMYSWLWLWSAASTGCAVRRPARAREWTVWILLSLAGLHTHYYFAFVWLAQVAWLAAADGWRARLRSLLAASVVAAACLPWYRTIPSSLREWRITGNWLYVEVPGPEKVLAAARLAHSWFSPDGVWGATPWLRGVQVLLLVLFLGAVWRYRGKVLRGGLGLLAASVVAAVTGPLALDLSRGTITVYIERYGLAGMPAGCVLVGCAIAAAGRLGPMLVLGLLAGWTPAWQKLGQGRCWHYEPYALIADVVAKEARADDLLLVQSIPSGVAGLCRTLPPELRVLDWVEPLGVLDADRDLPPAVAGRGRVFLVEIHAMDARRAPHRWLADHAVLESERWFDSAGVWVYRLP